MPPIQVTFTSPPHMTILKAADERLCCIQAENVIRAWMKQGFPVVAKVQCADRAAARRVSAYLSDVVADVVTDSLVAKKADAPLR